MNQKKTTAKGRDHLTIRKTPLTWLIEDSSPRRRKDSPRISTRNLAQLATLISSIKVAAQLSKMENNLLSLKILVINWRPLLVKEV